MRRSINVWHACGIFGWSIPWAEWQAEERPITPINWLPDVRPRVYLYSLVGQEDPTNVYPIPESHSDTFIGAVCVDEFIEGNAVNWKRVYQKLLEASP